MSTKQSSICSGSVPAAVPMGQEVICQYVDVAVATADLTLGDIIHLGILPANCVPEGYILDVTDMDTNGAPALVLDFGIITSAAGTDGTAISIAANDGGDEWIDGSTLGQAGGIVLHTATAAAFRVLKDVQPVNYDRKVALVVAVAPATAAAGTASLQLKYRAA